MTFSTPKNRQRQQCCYRAALTGDAGYCDECGRPLLRCAAFEECGGLLSSEGHCQVCVAPRLWLRADSVREASVGGKLVLGLELQNAAAVARPLFVKGLWTRESQADWQEVELPWERLEAGAAAPFSVKTREFEQVGVHELELMLAFASRFRWREEVLAFTTQLSIRVEEHESVSVQQNIHYSGDAPQTGATIYAPLRFNSESKSDAGPQQQEPAELTLTRASVLERRFGLRGSEGAGSVRRNARIQRRGFDAATVPVEGPVVTGDGLLKFGRSRSRLQGGTNDVRLLAFDANGELDEGSSCTMSRHHFSVYIENDRLMLQVCGSGLLLDGSRLQRGETAELKHGSIVHPMSASPELMALRIEFETQHGEVSGVSVSRIPCAPSSGEDQ